MPAVNKTLWFNVTTSLNWKRPPVGVVRVEQSIFEQLCRMANFGFDVRPCHWNGHAFVEAKAILQPQQPGLGSSAAVKTDSGASRRDYLFTPIPKREAAKQLAQGLFSLVPAVAKPHADRLLRQSKKLAIRYVIWRSRQHQLSYSQPPLSVVDSGPDLKNCPFRPGDIFLSMGLDWDSSWYPHLHDIKRKYGIQVITCCYDLIPVLFPQYCVGNVAEKFTSYFVDLAHASDLILCISQQTQRDLVKLLDETGAPPTRTAVFPLGDNVPEGNEPPSEELRKLTERPFILFVSTIERRKNHQLLYKAYHLLCAEGYADSIPNLVFVGMSGWGVNDLLMDIELDPLTKGKIFQFTHITDSALRYLYERCEYFAYPSLYEGWGLPVGEALSLGKVVLASDQGSLPEVGGDLVTYLDAWNPRAWATEILRLAQQPAVLAERAARVREEYRPRTWLDGARVVAELVSHFEQGPASTLYWQPGYDLSTEVGVHVGPEIHSAGRPGWLAYGPHRSLTAGRQHIQVTLTALSASEILLDATSAQASQVHGKQAQNLEPGPHTLELVIDLEQPVTDFEFRCKLISGDLRLSGVKVERLREH
ncbi:hypothetical protein NS383_10360 [Pseudomonas oryzihabitans]|nr:hypothetical protein NS383_10360 [Pseudomonas psychrotolerans]